MRKTKKIFLTIFLGLLLVSSLIGLSACELIAGEGSSLIACEHQYDEWSVEVEPTCESMGYNQRVCEKCSNVEYQFFAPKGHTFTDWQPLLHTESSYIKYRTCEDCGISKVQDFINCEHNYLFDSMIVYPTCEQAGLQLNKCKYCHEYLEEIASATGHCFEEIESLGETCTENGYASYVCVNGNCGEIKNVILYAHGHSFDLDGVCEECGFTLTVHTHEFTETVTEATCITMGYTTYICDCGYSYTADYIELCSHNWDAGVETKNTCEEDGKIVWSCQNDYCNAQMEKIIPASHEWSETIEQAATCTVDGLKQKICLACGQIESEIILAGHTWETETVLVSATCTEKGSAERYCTVDGCNGYEIFEIEVLGHRFVNGNCTECSATIPEIVVSSAGSSLYGMYFKIEDIISNYGPEYINEYGVMLDYNQDAQLKRVAVYLTQDGTMWRRCIAAVGEGITYATYVPYLSYGEDIKYTGQNSAGINTFSLRKDFDGIWCYNDYATIGVNLEDMYGNLLLSLYNIGQAGAETRIFDDLEAMKAWLKYGDIEPDHMHEMGEWVEVITPTCTKSGMERRDCATCDYYETKIIEKLGHQYEEGVCIRCSELQPTNIFVVTTSETDTEIIVTVSVIGKVETAGFALSLGYDVNNLTYVSADTSTAFAPYVYDDGAGTVTIISALADNVTENSDIVEFTFVKSAQPETFTLTIDELYVISLDNSIQNTHGVCRVEK